MKLISPIAFIASLFIAACTDKNDNNELITPFCLDKVYYEVRLERSPITLHITNGSGDISLAIEDENILNATYEGGLYADDLRGVISLHGKQKGSTTLTITDNITKDVETVEVKVTDCYLAYAIATSNHPALKANTILFFVNNPEKECYIFTKDNIHGKLYEQPIAKGYYDFYAISDSKEQFRGIPCLRLTYHADEKGSTSDKETTATSYDFQMKLEGEDATSEYAFDGIHSYLDVDWEKLLDNIQTKSLAPIDMTMTLIIPDTEYQTIGVLSTVTIPEHILN